MIVKGELFVESGETLEAEEVTVIDDLRVQGELDVGTIPDVGFPRTFPNEQAETFAITR